MTNKRVLFRVTGSLVALLIFLFVLPHILNLFINDIPPIDDSDLRPAAAKVADQDNTYFDLLKANETIVSPEDESMIQKLIGTDAAANWNEKSAEELLQRYAQPLAHFSSAARNAQLQYPMDEKISPPNDALKVIRFVRSVQQWLKLDWLKIMLLSKKGQEKEAMDAAMNHLGLIEKLRGPQVPLLVAMIGSAFKTGTLAGIQKDLLNGITDVQGLVRTSKLDSQTLKQYSEILSKLYSRPEDLSETIKTEYQWSGSRIEALLSLEAFSDYPKFLVSSYHMKPNKTKLLVADFTRAFLKSPRVGCSKDRSPKFEELAPSNPVAFYFTENALGKIFADNWATAIVHQAHENSITNCKADFELSATRALIGIKGYKNDNGSLPDSLQQLVPAYLPSVPVDPYSGKPIQYSKEKKQLFSSENGHSPLVID